MLQFPLWRPRVGMGNIAIGGTHQPQPQPQPQLQQEQIQIEDPIWVSHVWLLGEISLMIGCEEMLQTACNVCRAWRSWCNTEVTVLDVGNDFRLLYSPNAVRTSTILATPLFLPLVPLSLRELSLSGDWTVPTPQELATIRRGCRLRKLVMTGVRLFSSSYRELLLFKYLEELNISDTHVDFPFPPLRFVEPAGAKTSPLHSGTPELEAAVSDGGGGAAAGGVFDYPRFARGLRKLTASTTWLWMRWDLSAFPLLKVLEVSYAGRALLQQLRRKAERGSWLAELSVCDLALRDLVDAFGMEELVQAVGDASTFRLRRVNVGKEGTSFPYLRTILSGLNNLQVLELTDVGLDDRMLSALGGFLFSASARLPANGGAAGEASLGAAGGPLNTLTLDGLAAAGARSIASLRTLILGHCGRVSETALEKFLCLIGGEGGDRVGAAKAGVGRRENGSIHEGRGDETALSCVRLRGCKALGDRGLAALCRGTRGGMTEIEVSGSSLLTDDGIENLAKSCPRLTSVDFSGCSRMTTNALSFLLAECPALRKVKALSVTVTGKPIRGVALYRPTFVTPVASAAAVCALREAYEQRKVELVWTAPIPPDARDNDSNCSSSISRGKDGDGDAIVIVGGNSGDGNKNRHHQQKPLRERSSNGWKPCEFGCGASLASNYMDDHLEVCPFAPVGCLLRVYGCSWTGSRLQHRKHLERCPMWRVKCPECSEAVQAAEYAEHVRSHSISAEAPALQTPGCALRAYGCRACSTTNLVPTAYSAARNPPKGIATVEGVASGSEALNRRGRGGEVVEEGHCKGRPKDDGGRDAVGRLVHNLGRCPVYRLFCPSCELECRWVRTVHGYIGGEGKKMMGEIDLHDHRLEVLQGVPPC